MNDGWRRLFESQRRKLLRCVTVVCFAPVPLTLWLIARAPRSEWDEPLGPKWWWVIPAGLIGLSLVLPTAVMWLHDRYVLRLEKSGDSLRLITFLIWGARTRELTARAFAAAEVRHVEGRSDHGGVAVNAPYLHLRMSDGRRLLFDTAGHAPEGWQAINELGK